MYLGSRSEVPDGLRKLLLFEKQREVESYCRNFVLRQTALTSLISNAPRFGLQHFRQHREFRPEHLTPTQADLLSIRASVEPNAPYPKKILRKFVQVFKERKHVSAHLFASEVHWHLFYLTFQDLEEFDNHWEHGPHVHFVNFLWPSIDLEAVWKSFESRNSQHPGVHIRWLSTSKEFDQCST
ncbi:MAG: hypothetical protein ABI651_09650 [Verrucomicrobiota bacterium]